jgi:excisionase family DNA binding protein
MTNPHFSRSVAAALRAAAEAFERDADAVEANTRASRVPDSEPFESDWVRDVVAKLPPLATISETADTLRMSRRTVSRLLVQGRLNAVRTGVGGGSSRVLIARAEIACFLRRLHVDP